MANYEYLKLNRREKWISSFLPLPLSLKFSSFSHPDHFFSHTTKFLASFLREALWRPRRYWPDQGAQQFWAHYPGELLWPAGSVTCCHHSPGNKLFPLRYLTNITASWFHAVTLWACFLKRPSPLPSQHATRYYSPDVLTLAILTHSYSQCYGTCRPNKSGSWVRKVTWTLLKEQLTSTMKPVTKNQRTTSKYP